ncbi:hypothetical protein OG272_43775 [Streptomyces sp. NBC_00104]|uniref:hypothetical protein n=1 Tax=unclassified Streptomyces TaxID=2593676 RepID=UPI002E1EE542
MGPRSRRSAGALRGELGELGELRDLGDIVLVDEGGPGEHRLLAAAVELSARVRWGRGLIRTSRFTPIRRAAPYGSS